MRFLKRNARVMLISTLVITALLLAGLMMVPQQGKKIGLENAYCGGSCKCPSSRPSACSTSFEVHCKVKNGECGGYCTCYDSYGTEYEEDCYVH